MPVLTLNIELQLGDFHLRVDDSLPLDGVTALFGPSGSGKSTLLRIIAGLERRARGLVSYGPVTWQDAQQQMPVHRRHIGVVFQDGRLFTHLNVAGNLDFARRRAPRDRAGPDLDAVVRGLDLQPLLDRRVQSLSGGERQRVALGRSLLGRPCLLLLDEPMAGLDARRRGELLPYLESLPGQFGIPMVYVSHALDEVACLADRMIVLACGQVAAHGPATEIMERLDLPPLTGRTEAGVVLSGHIAEHDGRFALTHISVAGHRLTVPGLAGASGSAVRLRVRARDVAIAVNRPEQVSIRNVLPARVLDIQAGNASAFAEVLLDLQGAHLRARLTRASIHDLQLQEGMAVWALIKSIALDGQPLASEI